MTFQNFSIFKVSMLKKNFQTFSFKNENSQVILDFFNYS